MRGCHLWLWAKINPSFCPQLDFARHFFYSNENNNKCSSHLGSDTNSWCVLQKLFQPGPISPGSGKCRCCLESPSTYLEAYWVPVMCQRLFIVGPGTQQRISYTSLIHWRQQCLASSCRDLCGSGRMFPLRAALLSVTAHQPGPSDLEAWPYERQRKGLFVEARKSPWLLCNHLWDRKP